MNPSTVFIALIGFSFLAFFVGRRKAVARQLASSGIKPHSLPGYHGGYVALWSVIPGLLLFTLWLIIKPVFLRAQVLANLPNEISVLPEGQLSLIYNDIRNLAEGNIVSSDPTVYVEAAAQQYINLTYISDLSLAVSVLVLVLVALAWSMRRVQPEMRARNKVEWAIQALLMCASTIAIFTTIGIFLSVLFESLRFFQRVPLFDFLFGLDWSPQTAIREDQVGSSGAFGAVPLFAGTLLISSIAMLVAVPVGLMSAIYLSEYASSKMRAIAKPML